MGESHMRGGNASIAPWFSHTINQASCFCMCSAL